MRGRLNGRVVCVSRVRRVFSKITAQPFRRAGRLTGMNAYLAPLREGVPGMDGLRPLERPQVDDITTVYLDTTIGSWSESPP